MPFRLFTSGFFGCTVGLRLTAPKTNSKSYSSTLVNWMVLKDIKDVLQNGFELLRSHDRISIPAKPPTGSTTTTTCTGHTETNHTVTNNKTKQIKPSRRLSGPPPDLTATILHQVKTTAVARWGIMGGRIRLEAEGKQLQLCGEAQAVPVPCVVLRALRILLFQLRSAAAAVSRLHMALFFPVMRKTIY